MISIVDRIDQLPPSPQRHVLTIGNFDGVHHGHQAVLQQVMQIAQQDRLQSCVLTFSNHPSEILWPDSPTFLLCYSSHKYALLKQLGLDRVIALKFTPELSRLTAQQFLELLLPHIPLHTLVLGHDATIGSERQGGRKTIEKLAEEMCFQVKYLSPHRIEGTPISSSLIREAIKRGQLDQAGCWLGRPYSLTGLIVPGQGKGRELGFPTLNIDVSKLCLPPYGVYGVKLIHPETDTRIKGIANLGIAPTLRTDPSPLLEVHLYEHPELIIEGWVEVTLERFLRPERKFASLEELKIQIAADLAHLIE